MKTIKFKRFNLVKVVKGDGLNLIPGDIHIIHRVFTYFGNSHIIDVEHQKVHKVGERWIEVGGMCLTNQDNFELLSLLKMKTKREIKI